MKRFDRVARASYVKGLAEWDMFPDDETREQAIKSIEKGMMPRSVLGWIWFVVFCSVLFYVPFFLINLTTSIVAPTWPHRGLLTFALAVVAYTGIVMLLIRRDIPRDLRRKLLECGVPICMKCGYALRGLPADRELCPECGRKLSEVERQNIRGAADAASREMTL